MSAFSYEAVDQSGMTHQGVIEADSIKSARQLLREQGWTPIAIQAAHEKRSGWLKRAPGLSTKELALITRQLAALLITSIPLEEALLAIAEQMEKARIKGILMGVRSRVLEGYSLADGLNDYAQAFPPLFCASVAAGEKSGHLEQVLLQLADYVEKQQALKQKLLQAIIYPSIMIVISVAIVTFLLIYVVPKMIAVFKQTGQALPWVTSWLIHFSHWVEQYGLVVLALMVVMVIGFFQALKNKQFRFRWHQIILKMPLAKGFIRLVNTSRFSRTFAILSSAGVDILQAMQSAAAVATNQPIQQAMIAASHKVREGMAIHRALKESRYFPVMSIYLIASGENSGQLEAMLERAANNQDNDLNRYIDTGLTLFEPFLILVMGGIVLFIVMAILLPIFSMDNLAGAS